ncbi:unnamed protein product [Tilletia caries]|uniref:FUN14 domain-containing protein n=1 Tax=Tilletia caries TaxID=13290 RepID=A0ABN7ISF2_9BASI|nr:unnamed protein product [Tilletia caries]CAD6912224.1 unnamed protein product [Tilletia caries]
MTHPTQPRLLPSLLNTDNDIDIDTLSLPSLLPNSVCYVQDDFDRTTTSATATASIWAPTFHAHRTALLKPTSTRAISTQAFLAARARESSSPILTAVAAREHNHNHRSNSAEQRPSTRTLSIALAGAALVLYTTTRSATSTLYCESLVNTNLPSGKGDSKSVNNPLNPDGKYPESSVNLYQLSFGTVTGFCAGVFIKKGLKAVAFLLGAGYVLLQYLSSQRLVNVNWGAISRNYNNIVDRAAGGGEGNTLSVRGWKGSKASRIWSRFVDFLTADFQPRATFLAGLVLGFRLG